MIKMSFKQKLKLLLPILLIVSSIFTHLFLLPKLEYKLQISEILFLLLMIFSTVSFVKIKNLKLNKIDISFLFLSFLYILNFIFHFQDDVLIYIIGGFYLIFLYFIFSQYLINCELESIKYIFKKSADIGFWTLVGIGIIGFGLYYFFEYSKFVLVYHNYPYFGDVFRIKGFSYSPNLYISLLSFFTILKVAFSRLNYYHILIVFGLVLMSLTKEGLILLSILFAIVLYKNKINYKFGIGSIIAAGILYVFSSFFIVSFKKNNSSVETEKITRVQTEKPIFENNVLKLYPTTYYEVFKGGVIMSFENPFVGVGIGKFQIELSKLKNRNLYPKYFQSYQPVDSYFGYSAQLGLFYFIFVILFIRAVIRKLSEFPINIKFYFTLFLLYIMFESMALGSFHFRHYYIFLAIMVSIPQKYFIKNEELK